MEWEAAAAVTLNSEQISIHRILSVWFGLDRIGLENDAKKPSPNNYYHHHIFHIYGYFMSAISHTGAISIRSRFDFVLFENCSSVFMYVDLNKHNQSWAGSLAHELKKAKTSIRTMLRQGDSYRLQFHMVILLYCVALHCIALNICTNTHCIWIYTPIAWRVFII